VDDVAGTDAVGGDEDFGVRPAPKRSMATMGAPLGFPSASSDWQSSILQPLSEGWLWLLTAWPTTMAGIMEEEERLVICY
jgi:hypothetical protein